jgi:hypothetical protein
MAGRVSFRTRPTQPETSAQENFELLELPRRYSKGTIRRVAFVADPAEYRSSGVMTFIVNGDGVVYQKDRSNKTDVLAKAMKEYNPNSSWQIAKEKNEETVRKESKLVLWDLPLPTTRILSSHPIS